MKSGIVEKLGEDIVKKCTDYTRSCAGSQLRIKALKISDEKINRMTKMQLEKISKLNDDYHAAHANFDMSVGSDGAIGKKLSFIITLLLMKVRCWNLGMADNQIWSAHMRLGLTREEQEHMSKKKEKTDGS